MCEPVSMAVMAVGALASAGIAAKNAHDQKVAAREAQEIQQEAENKKQAALERKGPEAIAKADTSAADAERRRRTAVANNASMLTSRQGALGVPNTASTALNGVATRTTMG